MNTAAQKPRYHAPSITPHVESVSLSDFDIDEIREYPRHYNSTTDDAGPTYRAADANFDDPSSGLFISQAEFNRVETLVLCGQRNHAHEVVLRLISEAIGRTI